MDKFFLLLLVICDIPHYTAFFKLFQFPQVYPSLCVNNMVFQYIKLIAIRGETMVQNGQTC